MASKKVSKSISEDALFQLLQLTSNGIVSGRNMIGEHDSRPIPAEVIETVKSIFLRYLIEDRHAELNSGSSGFPVNNMNIRRIVRNIKNKFGFKKRVIHYEIDYRNGFNEVYNFDPMFNIHGGIRSKVKKKYGEDFCDLGKKRLIFEGYHIDRPMGFHSVNFQTIVQFKDCQVSADIEFNDCTFGNGLFFLSEFIVCEKVDGKITVNLNSNDTLRIENSNIQDADLRAEYVRSEKCEFRSHSTKIRARDFKAKQTEFYNLDACGYLGDSNIDTLVLTDCRFVEPFILYRRDINNTLNLSGSHFKCAFVLDSSNLRSVIDFSNLEFDKDICAPTFFGTEFHDSTVWGNIRNWPKYKNKNSQDAEQMIHAYEHLRHEMNKRQKHSEEKEFYRLEMLCRRRHEPLGKKVPNYLFGYLSDYGLSVWRPVVWLVGVFLFFWLSFYLMPETTNVALELSASSILGPLGMRREIFSSSLIESFSTCVHVLMGLESIVGLILIFLIGLGVRNQFKIKI